LVVVGGIEPQTTQRRAVQADYLDVSAVEEHTDGVESSGGGAACATSCLYEG
jgi:hypothetical protein